jgi:Zn finger protein HypA/HybF involved in hydrogenase expression
MTYITTSGYSASGSCTAHIAINRNRVKEYSGQTVYLKDGSNFEIELYNSKQVSVLAKIYLNGKLISNKGIVLRPGERVFLERYIEQNKKFLFSTYEVDDTSENKKSIQKNGEVKVEFYDEQSISTHSSGSAFWINPNYITPMYFSNTGGLGNIGTTTATYNTTTFTSSTSDMLFENNVSKAKSIETGRVETGGVSNQSMSEVNGNYNTFASSWSTIKILPESTKPVEVSQIRNYCSSCGTRVKKSSWKFCPTCGSKFD